MSEKINRCLFQHIEKEELMSNLFSGFFEYFVVASSMILQGLEFLEFLLEF